MSGKRYAVTVHLHGTLAANAQGQFKVPGRMALQEVSACASNNSDATLDVGTDSDPDGILSAATIGDSGTPTVYDQDDWDGALATAGELYQFEDGDIVEWALDYDGSAGTAAQNVMIVFTFLEG